MEGMEPKPESHQRRKNAKSRRDTAVQGTNDSSIISKCSMVTQGYFVDPFYEYFVNKCQRRAPLINRGYYIRVKTVNHLIRNFLGQNSEKKQIISIGAGFDTTFFRLKSEGHLQNTVFVEIDFPELVARKHALISSQNVLNQLLGEKVVNSEKSPLLEINTTDYKLLGVDLTQLSILDAALLMCGVDVDLPTLILSECVLTYMTRRCSTSVVGWGCETFANSCFVLYEQINPDDAFGMFMQNHFHIVGSPLKCINSYPTMESQKNRFLKQGWSWCEAYDMNQFYCNLLDQSERDRVEKLEPFDEHEEWHVKCSHYMILLAYSQSNIKSIMCSDPKSLEFSYTEMNRNPPINNQVLMDKFDHENDVTVKRFSHVTGNLNEKIILIFGGFGEQDGRHQRLTEIGIYNLQTNRMCTSQLKIPGFDFPRMHLTAATLQDGRIFIIGGRNSPFKISTGIIVISLKSKSSENSSSKCDKNTENGTSDSQKLNKETNDLNLSDVEPKNKTQNSESINNSDSESIIDQDTWTENTEFCDLTLTLCKETGSIPQPRWRHAVCSVVYEGVEQVLLYGGRTMNELTLSDCYLLNTKTSEWKQLELNGDTPGSRQSHTLCVWKNQVILYGGLNDQLLPTSDVFILDMDSLTWRKLNTTGTLYQRYSHTCHVIDDKMIAIGGVNLTHNSPGIAVVDLQTGKCQEFSLPVLTKDNLVLFHQHATVLLPSRRILVIGGGGNCFSFGTHLNKTPFLLDISKCLSDTSLGELKE